MIEDELITPVDRGFGSDLGPRILLLAATTMLDFPILLGCWMLRADLEFVDGYGWIYPSVGLTGFVLLVATIVALRIQQRPERRLGYWCLGVSVLATFLFALMIPSVTG